MDPLTASAALKLASFIPDIFKGTMGIVQNIRGNKLEDGLERPYMDIPKSALEALERSKQLASENLLPAQGVYEQQLDKSASRSLAGAREGARNPAQLLEAAMGIGESTNDSVLGLAIKGAERKDKNQGQLNRQLNTMASWEKMQFDTNEMQPFLDDAALASSLKGSGLQNMFGALDGISANASALGENMDWAALLKKLSEGEGKKKETTSEGLTNPTDTVNIPNPNYEQPGADSKSDPYWEF